MLFKCYSEKLNSFCICCKVWVCNYVVAKQPLIHRLTRQVKFHAKACCCKSFLLNGEFGMQFKLKFDKNTRYNQCCLHLVIPGR